MAADDGLWIERIIASLGKVGKALYVFIIAFLGALTTVMVGDVGFGDITDGQWVSAVLTGLIAASGMLGITNVQNRMNGET